MGEGKLKGKWCGGACGPDGFVYAMPHSAKHVLRIDGKNETITAIGRDVSEFGDSEVWLDGVLANDGCIYAVPSNANKVLKIEKELAELNAFMNRFNMFS